VLSSMDEIQDMGGLIYVDLPTMCFCLNFHHYKKIFE